MLDCGIFNQRIAIVANPKQTKTGRELSADLVIISELRLGVVELKDNYNEIKCDKPGEVWLAGSKAIQAGSDKNDSANPHQQVQAYAADIRRDLIATNSFPGEPRDWEKFAVLSCKDVREWGAELRFNVNMGKAYGYRPDSWTPEQVYSLAPGCGLACGRPCRQTEPWPIWP